MSFSGSTLVDATVPVLATVVSLSEGYPQAWSLYAVHEVHVLRAATMLAQAPALAGFVRAVEPCCISFMILHPPQLASC